MIEWNELIAMLVFFLAGYFIFRSKRNKERNLMQVKHYEETPEEFEKRMDDLFRY